MGARRYLTAAVAIGAVATTTGCLGGTDNGSGSGDGATTATGSGKSSIEVMYGFGNEQEAAFQKDLNAFAAKNGFTIKFTKAGSWDTEIRTRIAGGSPPDVGLFPQPGVMCDVASDGGLVAYDDATVTTAKETLVPGFVESGTCAGKVYGLPSAVSVKSLLWYDQAAWKETGLTFPTTMDELLKVTDDLRGSGKTPWCIAAESGPATGWPITDWIEDLVLRTAGPEGYDKWVKGEMKFNSPDVKAAFDYFHTIAFTEGNVLGGTKAIASTNFQTGGNALFKSPPGCYLFKQATFIAGKGGFPTRSWPSSTPRSAWLPSPPRRPATTPSSSVATSLRHSTTTSQHPGKLRNFIASKDNGIETGKAGYFSPHKTFDVSLYPSKTLQTIAKDVLYKSAAARFDGSDLMPAKVGAGTFWTEPIKWINGQMDEDQMLANIDKSWPAS
jgi:alpha-glucoside transport system substrate-binding protein